MRFQMIIAEPQVKELGVWQEAFSQVQGVLFLRIAPAELLALPGLDAMLVTNWFGHEQHGGRQVIGVAAVLSTKGAKGRPPWVITFPPLSMDLKRVTEDVIYRSFVTIFQAIKQCNLNYDRIGIETFGMAPSIVGCSGTAPFTGAKAARAAYLEEWFGDTTSSTGPLQPSADYACAQYCFGEWLHWPSLACLHIHIIHHRSIFGRRNRMSTFLSSTAR
ncbi:MAG: hypothetical protein ACR2PL_28370 [Dehalococcoidia bacterium]